MEQPMPVKPGTALHCCCHSNSWPGWNAAAAAVTAEAAGWPARAGRPDSSGK